MQDYFWFLDLTSGEFQKLYRIFSSPSLLCGETVISAGIYTAIGLSMLRIKPWIMEVNKIISSLMNNSVHKPYNWLPAELGTSNITGVDEKDVVLKVLEGLLTEFDLKRSTVNLPDSVRNLYGRELKRIRTYVNSDSHEKLTFHDDVILKDIAILTFRLIPVGAEFAEPNSKVWIRKVFFSNTLQFLKASCYFLKNRIKIYPYFQLHMHQESHDDFNYAGWIETFKCLADLLEANQQCQGWYSASWFNDPALEEISPHLAYLRTIPLRNGGGIFYIQKDTNGKTGALATSKTRRRLFDEGKYIPQIYLRIWPRNHTIRWRNGQFQKEKRSICI